MNHMPIILFSFLAISIIVVPTVIIYFPFVSVSFETNQLVVMNSYLTHAGLFIFIAGLISLLYLTTKVGGSLKETMIFFNLGFFSFSLAFLVPFININVLVSKTFMVIGAISVTIGVIIFVRKLQNLEK